MQVMTSVIVTWHDILSRKPIIGPHGRSHGEAVRRHRD
jgi:hypothetical protein